jgi:SAM-dependent methyltransferase
MPIDWFEQEVNYASQISDDLYHKLRTEFVLRLFPAEVNLVVDFGCGEGFFSELMLRRKFAKKVIGLDPSPNLIEIASKNQYLSHNQNCKISLGGASELADIQESSVDLVIALNVLAYMKPSEESLFYKESSRILKPGGYLLVTHSNVLFDMFTMNNLTVDFFIRNFKVDISEFLDLKELAPVQTYGIRENPLSYSTKLSEYGFKQLKIDFFHHHSDLPRRSNNLARNQVSHELELRSKIRYPDWQEFFMSSTFGVLARLC